MWSMADDTYNPYNTRHGYTLSTIPGTCDIIPA